MTIPLAQLIETAERSFAEHQLTEPVGVIETGHPLREVSAHILRSAAKLSLDVAQRLDRTPLPLFRA